MSRAQVPGQTPRFTISPTKRVFQPIPPDVERVGKAVLDAAFRVHTALGSGLLESVYRTTVKYVLETNGILAETEVQFPIVFEGVKLESSSRLDLVANNCVIAELKSVEKMNAVFDAQLLTYLRLSGIRLGLLINFSVPHLKDGIKRIVV